MAAENPVDLYRATPIRYLGYANEVGEAFRSIIGSKWVAGSYAVATGYVIADTVDKTRRTHLILMTEAILFFALQEGVGIKKTTYVMFDTLAWQMLASVAIPGLTINRVCAVANYFLKKSEKLPKATRRWSVTGIGLATIPFIIKPIDDLVDKILDESLRKYCP